MKFSCKDITHLLLDAEERPLGAGERLSVRLHLSVCAACTAFTGQLRLMREALQRWKTDEGDQRDPPGP